jgi:hypothetical protein
MGNKGLRAVLVGAGGVFGAVAVAAMMSATAAPTARADAYSDIIADIQAEEADAATAFSTSSTDFAGNDPADGLTQLFIGLDDDLVGVPNILEVGSVDALTSAPVIGDTAFEFSFPTPETYTGAVTEAQGFYTEGNTLATEIGSLPITDYADTALDNSLSYIDQLLCPTRFSSSPIWKL